MGKEDDAIFPSLESSGVSSKEYKSIVETIKPAEKAKKLLRRRMTKLKLQNTPTSMVAQMQ